MCKPPYTPYRFKKAVEKAVKYQAIVIRDPRACVARALASYWEKEARKAAGL